MLPRGDDARWDDHEHPDHLRPATRSDDGRGTELTFDVAAARPLPARAGSVCAWTGNTVHWGTKCRLCEEGEDERGVGGETNHQTPRRSIACTFRRTDAPAFECGGGNGRLMRALTRAECRGLDVAGRARLIAQGLALYSRWFDYPTALPGLE